jgi:hypothetical protein
MRHQAKELSLAISSNKEITKAKELKLKQQIKRFRKKIKEDECYRMLGHRLGAGKIDTGAVSK